MNHSLQIDRVLCECLIPRDQSSNTVSRGWLEDIAAHELPRALAELLEPLCPEQDESIWLIRRLEVSFGADLAWDATRLTHSWASAVAQSLLQAMQDTRDGQAVFHYRSRGEYLAAFVTDLAQGVAWNKWQYNAFSGLRSLPCSAALYTVFVNETETVLGALALLTPSALRRVLGSLVAHDAEQVWSRLAAASRQPGGDTLGVALDTWESDGIRAQSSPHRDALWLLVRCLQAPGRRAVEERWREAVAAVEAIEALDTLRSQTPVDQWPGLETALLSGRLANLPKSAWSIAGDGLRYWNGHAELFQRAAAMHAGNAAKTESRAESRATAFGAVFLLLPLIEELPAEAWSAKPELLKLAVFVNCCAGDVRGAARHDPLLRDLFGVDADCNLEDLAVTATPDEVWNWMRETQQVCAEMPLDESYLGSGDAVAAAAHSVLRTFAWKLPGFGTCSLSHLWSNFLDFGASIDLELERIVVRMACPPLQVILRLAGLTGGSYHLPRIDPRPFQLFQEA